MADYEVGNLQIKFSALDEVDFKKISQGLNSVKRAIIGITNIDTGRLDRFSDILSDLSTQFLPFLQGVEKASGGLAVFNDTLRQVGGRGGARGLSSAVAEFQNIKKETQEEVAIAEQLGINLREATEEQLAQIQAIIENNRRLEEQRRIISELKEEMGQGEKQTKKSASGWKKFLNQIKRIAIYRLIRTALRAIVSTFRDTINAFAEVDDNVNNAMSQITTSLQFIKLGLGSTILPLLQMIAPIVEQIGYSFANLGNMISASLSKDGKFTKINTKAWKDYREEIENTNSALLDFDKFRVLNRQQTSLSDFLIPNQDAKEYLEQIGFNEFAFKGVSDAINGISKLISEIFETIVKIGNSAVFKTVVGVVTEVVGWLTQAAGWVLDILNNSGLIEPILGGILGYLIAIGVTKIITALSGGKLLSWIGAVVSLLREDLSGTLKMLGGDFVKIISSTKALAAGIGALTGSVLYFISAWKDLNSTQRLWIPLGSALVGIIVGIGTALVLSITAIKEALKLNPAAIAKAASTAALFTAAAGIAIGTAISQSQNSAKAAAQGYAQGGLPDRGTLFYAGEAGAEMVYNMPSGQSGVANVTQIQQAFYNALVQYGRENRGGDGAINVNIDGQAVFKAVDREAGKRGLGFARR